MIGGVDIAINNDHTIDDNYVKVTIPEGIGKSATYDLYVIEKVESGTSVKPEEAIVLHIVG
ncbi:MAG: hypothetical protein WCF03_09850 [Nitrososphaeraceae archaeon]